MEINKTQGEIANSIYDKVFIGDIESDFDSIQNYFKNKFDIVTFADVLEHLKDPWNTLEKIKGFLDEDGIVIASIPNLAHWGSLKKIIYDKWIYTNAGILDRTHLRFFTKTTITDMFNKAGYKIEHIGEITYPGLKKNH